MFGPGAVIHKEHLGICPVDRKPFEYLMEWGNAPFFVIDREQHQDLMELRKRGGNNVLKSRPLVCRASIENMTSLKPNMEPRMAQ